MDFLKIPNIPKGPTRLALVDGRISKEIEQNLKKRQIELIKTEKYEGLYEAISYHPDIMMHHLGGEWIVYAPGTSERTRHQLSQKGFQMVQGETSLSFKYPHNIAYNVARIGKFAVHNFRYTDPVLLRALKKEGIELIHVKQGYSKCAVSIVDENSIMTLDSGIAKAVSQKGIEVLLLEKEDKILLPGLNHGFIGGSTGLIDGKKWAITGSVCKLRNAKRMIEFMNRKGIEIIELSLENVVDIGTILTLL